MHKATPVLPDSGYALLVDGLIKAEFETAEGARQGAIDLKRRFPMLQVKVYDAVGKRNEVIACAD